MSAFAGKYAVITGGAGGIGRALGEGIVAQGGQVLYADLAGDDVFACDVSRLRSMTFCA